MTLLLLTTGCTNIDCPLDNVVMMKCDFYSKESGVRTTLAEILTVRPASRDTILLNQATALSSILLPLKEGEDRDTLLFQFSDEEERFAEDTLFIQHKRQAHFESVDCPSSVFHTITEVRAVGHDLSLMPVTVDSVALIRSLVNYDDIENVRIFLRATPAE